jgi:hypothetical protein
MRNTKRLDDKHPAYGHSVYPHRKNFPRRLPGRGGGGGKFDAACLAAPARQRLRLDNHVATDGFGGRPGFKLGRRDDPPRHGAPVAFEKLPGLKFKQLDDRSPYAR